MNETNLILNAIKSSLPVYQSGTNSIKNKSLVEIDPLPPITSVSPAEKTIQKLGRRYAKNKQLHTKAVCQWTNTDFVIYIKNTVQEIGISLDLSMNRDRNSIGKIYDSLAETLREQMDNTILKEYIDWWISSHGTLIKQHSLKIPRMQDSSYISVFLKNFNSCKESHTKLTTVDGFMDGQANERCSYRTVDEDTLYNLGGIKMLLLSKGIVSACSMVKKNKLGSAISVVTDVLRQLSRDSMIDVMESTVSRQYSPSDTVDFVSMVRPFLDKFGIDKYLGLDYKTFFV